MSKSIIALAMLLLASPAVAATIAVPAAEIRIVDGDTVRYAGARLRLLEIDAPEIGHARCGAERKAGEEAKAALTALVEGQMVGIVYSGRSDRYRRPLVHLQIAGQDVGSMLLEAGLALPYKGGRVAHDARAAHWCGRP